MVALGLERTNRGWSGGKRGCSPTPTTAEGTAWTKVHRGMFRTAELSEAAGVWVLVWGLGGQEPCEVRGKAGGRP